MRLSLTCQHVAHACNFCHLLLCRCIKNGLPLIRHHLCPTFFASHISSPICFLLSDSSLAERTNGCCVSKGKKGGCSKKENARGTLVKYEATVEKAKRKVHTSGSKAYQNIFKRELSFDFAFKL